MKRILITGKDSYIGIYIKKYLDKFSNDYYVEELDVRNDDWKSFSFEGFDTIFHVAGIAHIKEIEENEQLYFSVNRDLVQSIAIRAKKAGVNQFVFMSSMSVYGLENSAYPINRETEESPNTYYGKSKLEAEILLQNLEDEFFKICILRPPMVYGEGSPGNLTKLLNMVRKLHVFPTVKNERSSISVDKLAMFVKFYIDDNARGVYFPQNDHYMCTYQFVKAKMKEENIPVLYIPVFNILIRFLIGKVGMVTKAFGDLVYERE